MENNNNNNNTFQGNEYLSDSGISGEDLHENDGLLRVLDFGTTPKILDAEEMKKLIGGKIRLILQWEYNPADYEASLYYEVIGIRDYDNTLETKSLESEWPCISADKSELAEILKERGYTLTHEGRSGFASRNRYIISKSSPQMIFIKAPLLIQCRMGNEDKEKFGIVGNDGSSKHIIRTGESQEKEMISPSEIKEIEDILEKAKDELKQRRKKRMDEYIRSQKNGCISIVNIGGGPEDFHEHDIPENYIIIAQKRIACTQDCRRNISHTYAAVLIDTNAIQGKAFMKIKIPNEYKGLVIGSGGSNIKSLCEKLKCRIMIE